jgi:OOP family OmpA-OmpF porin
MSQDSGPTPHAPAGASTDAPDPLGQLRAVREIIAGPAVERAEKVDKKVSDPQWQRKTVANVLPAAIALSGTKSDDLAKALAPTIQSSIRESVRRDPRPIVDAISPIMGPAIRKSIADQLAALIESFNLALESTFTLQGIKWRIQAMRSGKPYAEVVLLNRLVYRVEEVFLIHKQTGLLLQHVVASRVSAPDADMVSGMLTAVRDLVKDTYQVSDADVPLDEIRLGDDAYMLVRQGSSAYLAGKVRGKANNAELGPRFSEAIEKIHATYSHDLADFKGDADVFVGARPWMEECLMERERGAKPAADAGSPAPPGRRTFPFFTLIGCIVVLILVAWLLIGLFREPTPRDRWPAFVDALKSQPGVFVTSFGERNGRFFVTGFRDPLAVDPRQLLRSPLSEEQVDLNLEPFQSMAPAFVEARARRALNPPESVKLTYDKDRGVLKAVGTASNRWISQARKAVRNVYGVTVYEDAPPGLVNPELDRLNDIKARLEALSVRFIFGTSDVAPGQADTVAAIADLLFQLHDLAGKAGVDYQVQVAGHTDSSGDETRNIRLSRDRADRMISLLVARGMGTRELTAVGVGPADPSVRQEASEKDRELNRRVSIKVLFLQQPLFLEEERPK